MAAVGLDVNFTVQSARLKQLLRLVVTPVGVVDGARGGALREQTHSALNRSLIVTQRPGSVIGHRSTGPECGAH